MTIGSWHKKIGNDRSVVPETDAHTDILITILAHLLRGQSDKCQVFLLLVSAVVNAKTC